MTQEQRKSMAPRWLAFVGVAATALLAAIVWETSTNHPSSATPKGAESAQATEPQSPSETAASPRAVPLRQWKPGDTFVYDIQNERVIGVDTSQMKGPRSPR